MADKPKGLAGSLTTYGDPAFSLYMRRAFARSMGFSGRSLEKPVIGICNTYSEFNNCHRHFPELVQAIKRGVSQAGGLPLEFPAPSLGEMFLNPTSMLFRNLMAMAAEEMITAQPMDGVILLGGCDKTIPALVMAAASADKPALVVAAGSMMTGRYRGDRLGACTDCRRFWGEHRGGRLSEAEIQEVEANLVPTSGTCMVMGTASTMACLTEALGLMLPGGASPPAVHAERLAHGEASGERIVAMVEEGLKPSQLLTADAFTNALLTLPALGGSTNAFVHLLAMARRAGFDLKLEDFDRIGHGVPLLVNLKPSGQNYMEDFHAAGGLPTVWKAMESLLKTNALAANGKTVAENLKHVLPPQSWQDSILNLDQPLKPAPTLVVLKGNLAPDGAVLKTAAATKSLWQHKGKACVFRDLDDLQQRIDDPDLQVDETSVLVLQNTGPVGAPGMPEAGYLPIPAKLAKAGVKDMLRVSDARMSGTAFGATVLHVSPESALGGPLSLVRDGDEIELDVAGRRLELLVDEKTLQARQADFKGRPAGPSRGYRRLFVDHVLPAHQGCDFDFLVPTDLKPLG